MKSAKHLLLTTTFIIFLGFSSQSQKSQSKYTEYDYGYYFYWNNKRDSAFRMFNRYVNNPDDTLKKGTAYKYIGEIQKEIGDLYGAQQSLTDAIKTLDPLNEKHRSILAISYNLLGNISLDLKQPDEAIHFYNKATDFATGTDYFFEVMNGKATAFQKKGNYKNAIAIYDSILALQHADQSLIARTIDNRARTKWLQDPDYPALPEFRYALKIRTDSSKYSPALNASYSHLSDYYSKSNPDSALWYAEKMRKKAKENKSPDDILEAIDKLIRLNNSPILKERWYEEYKILNDSLQLSRDTTRNRFAVIRYDFQKSKADNLILQQHITKQRLLIYGVIVFAVAIITGLSIWYNKRRKRIKQQSENAIRESKLKTSQKIHDVVANGLYVIMNELEHTNSIEQESLIDKIEELYEKSRNISYEHISSGNSADYNNQIHRILNSFASEKTKVIVVGNQQTFWSKITEFQKHELQLILNEIMINMKKHSQAKNVAIVFKLEDTKGFINYKDDGVGFPTNLQFGNGLNNTVSRIKSINGDVNFGKSEKGGLSISISFLLESNKI